MTCVCDYYYNIRAQFHLLESEMRIWKNIGQYELNKVMTVACFHCEFLGTLQVKKSKKKASQSCQYF